MNRISQQKMNGTHHVKLYKDGKKWVAMGITAFALGVTFLSVDANADTVSQPSDATSVTATVNAGTLSDNHGADSVKSENSSTAPVTADAASADVSSAASVTDEVTPSNANTDATDSNSSTQDTTSAVASQVQPVSTATTNEKTAQVAHTQADYDAAKAAAEQDYISTGAPQTVARVSSLLQGTYGTAQYDIDTDTGLLTIHAGTLGSADTPIPWDAQRSIIKNIVVQPGVIATRVSNWGNGSSYTLFGYMPNLETVDLSGLDTSAMVSMASMFEQDPNLTSIIFGPNFSTSNVTDLNSMFFSDKKLTAVDLANWDVSHVEQFHTMFANSGIQTLDLSKWDMSETNESGIPANIIGMFNYATSLWKIKVGPNTRLVASDLDNGNYATIPLNGSQVVTTDDAGNQVTVVAAAGPGGQAGWQAIDGGTDIAPAGAFITSKQLQDKYTGTNGETKTYVWSQKVSNPVVFKDVATGETIPTATPIAYNYVTGYAINTAQSTIQSLIPAGYHYATTSELNGNIQPGATSVQGPNGTQIIFYLAKNASITINFVDQNGNPVKSSETLTNTPNTQVNYHAPIIPGYTLVDPSQQTTWLKYQTTNSTLTLVYKKVSSTTNPGDGNDNGTPTTPGDGGTTPTVGATTPNSTTPNSGESVPETTVSVQRGQTPGLLPDNAGGDNGGKSQKGSGSVIGTSENGSVTANSRSGQTTTKTQTTLPQTNDSQSSESAIVGLGLLTSLLGLLGFKLRKQEQ